MARRYFEDFGLGEVWTSAPFEVGRDEMLEFARRYDPQPIHLNEAAAAAGPHGTLIASGWLIAALTLRAFITAGGYGETPVLGLGTDELRWSRVVRPGDWLTVRREVVGLRRSGKSPMNGLVTTRITASNQAGEVVLSMVATGMVGARAPA